MSFAGISSNLCRAFAFLLGLQGEGLVFEVLFFLLLFLLEADGKLLVHHVSEEVEKERQHAGGDGPVDDEDQPGGLVHVPEVDSGQLHREVPVGIGIEMAGSFADGRDVGKDEDQKDEEDQDQAVEDRSVEVEGRAAVEDHG